MMWPPIRFSYNTQNKNPPMAVSGEADLDADGDEDCKLAVERGFHPCNADLEGTGSAPTTRAATWWPA